MPEDSTPFDQGLFLVHLNRGKELFDKRHFVEAAEELEKARRMRPSDETVLNLLGLIFFKNERYKEADRIYTQLIGANPDSDVLHFNQGLVCFKLGSLDRAEAAFLRALEVTPENQKVNFYLGTIYEKKRQYYNAIFQYRKAGANIMVQRVESKIAAERAAGTAVGVAAQSTEDTFPPVRRPQAEPTHPEEQVTQAPPPPDFKVTVDHIDKTRFLSALRERSFAAALGSEAPPPEVGPPTEDSPPEPAASGPEHPPPTSLEPSPTETLAPGSTASMPAETQDSPGARRTVVEMTEPVIPDLALTEMSRTKTLSTATEHLFASRAPKPPTGSLSEDDHDTVEIPAPVRTDSAHSMQAHHPTPLADDEEPDTTHLYSRLRRRDDIFRYLENNLMEVNFSGKVFIKQGTIYSYSGNLTFWVKPQREESATPLVIVSGTGKLILSDRQREISVMQINGEKVFIEPSHLLACQETLTPRYAVIKKEGDPRARFQVLAIEGTGMIALSVSTAPLLLKVTPDYPVNISSAHVISWSGGLTPTIIEDEALADLMFPHARKSLNLRLEGTGKVMMEKLRV